MARYRSTSILSVSLTFTLLLSPLPARAILTEDFLSGVPVNDPSLYTSVGNQSRFDGLVSLQGSFIQNGVPTTSTFGTGVLLSPNIVLTAAHVVDDLAEGWLVPQNSNQLMNFDGKHIFIDGSLVDKIKRKSPRHREYFQRLVPKSTVSSV
jgi:hypothetical protein